MGETCSRPSAATTRRLAYTSAENQPTFRIRCRQCCFDIFLASNYIVPKSRLLARCKTCTPATWRVQVCLQQSSLFIRDAYFQQLMHDSPSPNMSRHNFILVSLLLYCLRVCCYLSICIAIYSTIRTCTACVATLLKHPSRREWRVLPQLLSYSVLKRILNPKCRQAAAVGSAALFLGVSIQAFCSKPPPGIAEVQGGGEQAKRQSSQKKDAC